MSCLLPKRNPQIWHASNNRATIGFQHPIDARPADAERIGDLGGAEALAPSTRAPLVVITDGAGGFLPGRALGLLGEHGGQTAGQTA
jgi:hypothetical protein